MLAWGKEKFGLHYSPEMVKHFAYVSDLTFYSDAPLLRANRAVEGLCQKTSAALSHIWGEPVPYEPLNISVGHDPTSRKYGIAPFAISRRAETPFSENKYFSEAPLPTKLHIQILEEFEAAVSNQ